MVTSTVRSTFAPARHAITAMYVGLVLTLATAILPVFTEGQLAKHVRSVYAGYLDPARIDEAVSAVLTYLFLVPGLGVVVWLVVIWAVRRRKRGARVGATLVLFVAAGLALTNLLAEEYGRNLLPAVFGVAGLVPCVAGAVAVTLLWLDRAPTSGRS